MKTQQWQLRKVTEPRTLADMPSSREKPVLCWAVHGAAVFPLFSDEHGVWIVTSTGGLVRAERDQTQYKLYTQPSRPKKLEEVPDRRVILSGVSYSLMMFSESNEWFAKFADRSDSWTRQAGPPSDWQLTDHCVELVETEIGVVG